MAEDRINNSNFSNIRAIIPLLLSYPERLCLTLVWSLGSEFGERIWPNTGLAGSEFGEKKRAKLWFGRFGVRIKDLAEPWFGVWVRSSEKGCGLTLVWQVWSSEKRKGPNPGSAGSEFR